MSQTWYVPSNLAEALDYLHQNPETRCIAGGTDLLVKHYEGVDLLPGLMGLGKLTELKTIETGDQISIGALVTHHEISQHPWLKEHVPMLSQGAATVGAPQIKHMGTIGGNIVNASPAADTVPPLIALGAKVRLESKIDNRVVPLDEFFKGPGKTVMHPGEILTKVEIPRPKSNQGGSYIKLGKRKAMAIATASIAVFASVREGKLEDIRICLGSVGPTPIRAKGTEGVLRMARIDSLPLAQAKEQLAQEISPIDDIRGTAEYRKASAAAIMERALIEALIQAGVKFNG